MNYTGIKYLTGLLVFLVNLPVAEEGRRGETHWGGC